MNANRTSRIISTIQILVSSLLTVMIITGLVLANQAGPGYAVGLLLGIFPEVALILGSFIPVLILRIKHRSQVAEGYLLPLFLLMLSLQTSRIIPSLMSFSGVAIISMTWIVILQRFFFIGTFTVLLYAAIQNMKNINTSKTGSNVAFSLIAAVVVSYIIPVNSTGIQSPFHDAIFNLLVLMIMLSAVMTYLISFVSDRESYHLKRFLTFLFISMGDFMIIVGDMDLAASAIGTGLFVTGAIMLSVVSPKGY